MTQRGFIAAVLIGCALGSAQVAHAQYFGQNKVRYEDFDYQVLKTEHFDIFYYEQERRVVTEAGQLAERWYGRLSSLLGHQLRGRQPLILYANHPDFEQTTVLGGFIDPSTGGVTESLQRRIVLPFTGSLQETDHVLGHELVHAFQYDMGGRGMSQLPLWFIEGMAEYLSVGAISAQTAAWLRDAAIHDDLPAFEELDNPRYFPYRFGHAAWAYMAGRFGPETLRELFLLAGRTGDALGAIEQLTAIPIQELSGAWHRSIAATYRALDLTAARPRGRALITEEMDGGRINVGPALSPDGTRLVFLSEKSMFSIEMFLADATTGQVLRKLTEVATDPHLDNIQFLESTGAWSTDGRLFAYVGVQASDPVLVVIDADDGTPVRAITLPEMGEIFNPTWAPDGASIAFSGMQGATSDLYIYELRTGRLRRLTTDVYAQIQPAWSPDGRTIAFVTDQFTTNLSTLDFGPYRIGAYDVATGAIRLLPGFDEGKNISPQWAPGAESFYFIAAPNGIANVFRASISTGRIQPVTSLTTAVSGITETSPALAVANRTGRLAYTAFVDGTYAIYVLEPEQAGEPVPLAQVDAAILPPAARGDALLANMLGSPAATLPSVAEFMTEDYSPSLGLSYVGAAAMTNTGADGFGTSVGGGISVLFSDTLNFHRVGGTVEASGGLADVAAQIEYLNQESRWNWGAAVQRVPYRTGTISTGVADVDGQRVLVEQTDIFRQVNYEVNGLAEYPFSRNARLEFSAGLRHIGFEREIGTSLFSLQTGRLIGERTQELDAPEGLNLGRASVAYVFDSALLGGTSPVLGTRSRFEVVPVMGDVRFTEALLDYRRYLVPVRPLTIATRLMHMGRYGLDAESGRLPPLFIGYPNLIRGYDVDSLHVGECRAEGRSDCPGLEQLVGSRVLVGNVEVRVPIPGVFQGEFNYGPLPIEAFAFADTGVAWTAAEKPSFLDGPRDFVSSVGVGARVNVFGYLITEFNAVRSLDRPGDDWMFLFNIRPGF